MELLAHVPAEPGNPAAGLRTVRFTGVDGPRWFLRGLFAGAAAENPAAAAPLEAVLREVVVVRGDHPMPPRDLLEIPFGPGLGVSAQAHALGPRILYITDLALRTAGRLYEVHPEVSFQAMNGCEPLCYRKNSAGGALERIELLRRHGIQITGLTETASTPLDDVLDAAAAAWSAHRIAHGTASSLPDPPELIEQQRVAIWY